MCREDKIAEAFNRLFEMQLDWNFSSSEQITIIRSEILALKSICDFLYIELSKVQVQNALWTLQMNKFHVKQTFDNKNLMKSFSLNESDFRLISRSLDQRVMREMFHASDRFGYPAADNREISQEGFEEIMESFFAEEENILRRAGLNQSSTAIIIARMRFFKQNIISNLYKEKSVLVGKYLRAIESLKTFVKRLNDVIDKAPREKFVDFTAAANSNLSRSKDKIIGLATLWADTLPLIINKDWGVASVISSTAAATVAVFYN